MENHQDTVGNAAKKSLAFEAIVHFKLQLNRAGAKENVEKAKMNIPLQSSNSIPLAF